MKAKTLDKNEHESWIKIIGETFSIVLAEIVKANILDPQHLGRVFAAYLLHIHASELTVDDKQNESIDWENKYMVECFIRQITCYRYFQEWTLGKHVDDECKRIENKFKEFHRNHMEEVTKYMQEVAIGFNAYTRELSEKYPNIDIPYL